MLTEGVNPIFLVLQFHMPCIFSAFQANIRHVSHPILFDILTAIAAKTLWF